MAVLALTVLFIGSFCVFNCQSAYRDVPTEQGLVKGFNVDDNQVFSFYGIPYASTPLGENRFKAPLPPPTWNNTFNATVKNIACPQGSTTPVSTAMKFTFDCLVINVFVPTTQDSPLPVYFFIHGGAFQKGFGLKASAIDLVKRGMIVVNFNYRLGLHGFLCLGTEYAPGNAGLKDQVAALKWVQRNIAKFGGDPNNISVGGTSAGSFSAELLMLSPMSLGLFANIILESGSALSPMAFHSNPLEIAESFANQQGVYTDQNLEELEAYYRSLTDDDIMTMTYKSNYRFMGFLPCPETHNNASVEKFLDDKPINLILRGGYEKRPILSGFSLMEGLYFVPNYDTFKLLMESNFSSILPNNLVFESTDHRNDIARRVKTFYFPTGAITYLGYIEYFTDTAFAYPQSVTAKLFAENSVPVYYFLFTYNGTVNLPPVKESLVKGPGHIAQTLYLQTFDIYVPQGVYDNMTPEDFLVQEQLRQMWFNFIKNGNPIPSKTDLLDVDWKPLKAGLGNFLEISLPLHSSNTHPLQDRFALWDEIYGR